MYFRIYCEGIYVFIQSGEDTAAACLLNLRVVLDLMWREQVSTVALVFFYFINAESVGTIGNMIIFDKEYIK